MNSDAQCETAVAGSRLIIRIAAAGAAVCASLLFGMRGVMAEQPLGDDHKSQHGQAAPHMCLPQAPPLGKDKADKKAGNLDGPLIHTCPLLGVAVALSQTPAPPAQLPPPSPPTVSPPLSAPPPPVPAAPQVAPQRPAAAAATGPIDVPTLTASVTALPPVTAAEPSPAVPEPAGATAPQAPSRSGGPADQASRQPASTVVPAPPLVLRLPTAAVVTAGAAAPAALTGVAAPAMGVTAACILVGLLVSIFLVRRR